MITGHPEENSKQDSITAVFRNRHRLRQNDNAFDDKSKDMSMSAKWNNEI